MVTEKNSNRQIRLLLVDKEAESLGFILEGLAERCQRKIEVSGSTCQDNGLEIIADKKPELVFAGVTGNGVGTATKKQMPWARYSIGDYVRLIKERSPGSKLVAFTGGVYTRLDALRDGADGYLFKTSMTYRIDDRLLFDVLIESVLEGKYWEISEKFPID
ncbi:hypothetical protein ACFLZN_01800 [Nanoarchaeota archaeon]